MSRALKTRSRSPSASRRPASGAALLALVVAMLSPVGSRAEIVYPTIAGTTVIRGQGVTGLTMSVPSPTKLLAEDISFSLEGGTYAVFDLGLGQDRPSCAWWDRMCLSHTGWILRPREQALGADWPYLSTRRVSLPVGLLDLYIMTDGLVTLTLRFSDTPGEMELEASGNVDGEMRPHPSSCPDVGCDHLGYGGGSRQVGYPGLVRSLSFAAFPRYAVEGTVGNAGTATAFVCVYPGGDRYESPDPAQHPTGCDFTPETSNPEPFDAINRLGGDSQGGYSGVGGGGGHANVTTFQTYKPGEQYTGYLATDVAVRAGGVGGYGYWLTRGIGCPSGDFSDCDA